MVTRRNLKWSTVISLTQNVRPPMDQTCCVIEEKNISMSLGRDIYPYPGTVSKNKLCISSIQRVELVLH